MPPLIGCRCSAWQRPKATPAAQTDMIWLDCGPANALTRIAYKNYRVAGADTRAQSERLNGFGYGVDAPNNPYNVSPKTMGFRWFPQAKRLFLLGQDGLNDMEEMALPASWDMTKRLYPFVGAAAVSGSPVERLRRMSMHVTPLVKALRDVSSTGLQFTGGAAPGTVIGQIENRYTGSTITFDNPRVAVSADGFNFVVGGTTTGTGADETLNVAVTETLGGVGSRTTQLTFLSKAPAVPEAETTAYLNRLSGSYTTTQKDAVNTFIKAGKTDGWWSRCDVIVPFAMANEADALLNMKAATFAPTKIGSLENRDQLQPDNRRDRRRHRQLPHLGLFADEQARGRCHDGQHARPDRTVQCQPLLRADGDNRIELLRRQQQPRQLPSVQGCRRCGPLLPRWRAARHQEPDVGHAYQRDDPRAGRERIDAGLLDAAGRLLHDRAGSDRRAGGFARHGPRQPPQGAESYLMIRFLILLLPQIASPATAQSFKVASRQNAVYAIAVEA
jgi:hypothetical protein